MPGRFVKFPFAAWNHFFHRETDLSIFGPIRIGYAALMLINVLAWWPNLERWFDENGVLTLAASRMVIDPDRITIFQWLPTTPSVVWACYLLLIFSLVNVLLGCLTRVNLAIVFVLFTSFVHRNNLICDGEDIIFRMMTFYLIFSPAGEFLSLPVWLKRKKGEDLSNDPKAQPIWPLRLIQIQTSCVLLFSGIEKLRGQAWLDGTAIYYVSRLDDLFCRFPVPEFLFESLTWIAIITWSTILLEITIPLAVWLPKTRKYALALAFVFHLSLDYMMNLNLFQWIMIVGWMSFLDCGKSSKQNEPPDSE